MKDKVVKKKKDKLERLNLVLRTIRSINQLLVKAKDRDWLLQGICNNLIDNRGYYNAWIALLDESGKLVTAAEAGLGDEFLQITDQFERGELTDCARTALKRSQVVLTQDPFSACIECPLSKMYAGRGAITVRLEHAGEIYGIISASVPKDLIPDEEEHQLLEEVAGDVAFALHDMELERMHKEADAAHQRSMQDLIQRNKELNCLFSISNLVERRHMSLGQLLRETVGLIPPALQYPEITCARITLGNEEFETNNFKKSAWRLSRDIHVQDESAGHLEVFYLEERPQRDEGPFLKGELSLLTEVAQRLGRIAERKLAEQALKESEERYKELLNNISSGVAVYKAVEGGDDFLFVDFNRAAEQIDGVRSADVIGKPVTKAFPGVKDFGLFEVFQRVWKYGKPEFFPEALYQDQKLASWRENYIYRLSSGEIVAVYNDVTERKQAEETLRKSEQRFRDLIENSLTGISIVQNDRIVYQNPEQERLLGALPRPPKLTDLQNIHPEDVEKVSDFYRSFSSKKEQSGEMEFRFYPPGRKGSRADMKWVHCRASTIEYRGRAAILVNMMDITRAKELEALLKVQDKMASLGHVAAGIAHEIRNPLSGINIYLNTLQKIYEKGRSLEKVKEILTQAQSASNKIESVIRRVMDFAKPSEPKVVLIDINEPIEEAIHLSSVTLRKSGISIEKNLSEDLPKCYADPQMIEQVILNLITNAAEAMKGLDKAKTIAITSSMERRRVVIRVSDSGPGVSSHLKDRIFDPFYTTKNGSTGIGLSLNHRIITDHGGSLSVSESKWGGAEFTVEIPSERPNA